MFSHHRVAGWLKWHIAGMDNLQQEILLNPSNTEATFVQSTMTKRFLKTIYNPVMLVLIG